MSCLNKYKQLIVVLLVDLTDKHVFHVSVEFWLTRFGLTADYLMDSYFNYRSTACIKHFFIVAVLLSDLFFDCKHFLCFFMHVKTHKSNFVDQRSSTSS